MSTIILSVDAIDVELSNGIVMTPAVIHLRKNSIAIDIETENEFHQIMICVSGNKVQMIERNNVETPIVKNLMEFR